MIRWKVGERDRLLAAAQTWRRRALLAEARIHAAQEDQQAKINALERLIGEQHAKINAHQHPNSAAVIAARRSRRA